MRNEVLHECYPMDKLENDEMKDIENGSRVL